MPFLRKCPQCSLDITDAMAIKCPICGTSLISVTRTNPWLGAAIQIVFATTFMLVFRFPKFMILVFVGLILIGTAVSTRIKPRPASAMTPRPPQDFSNPALYKIAGLGIAICALAIFSIFLFGSVIFLNSWSRWHQYEGQPFHRADFVVEQAYYQKNSKSISIYASGTVEGQREWMSLEPYVRPRPRSQAELDDRVPVGTSIPVYLFPDLKGRARVQVYEAGLPAETSHQAAINAVNHSLIGLAIFGIILFLMIRLQKSCVRQNDFIIQPATPLTS